VSKTYADTLSAYFFVYIWKKRTRVNSEAVNLLVQKKKSPGNKTICEALNIRLA
jgi:hypothetical protein